MIKILPEWNLSKDEANIAIELDGLTDKLLELLNFLVENNRLEKDNKNKIKNKKEIVLLHMQLIAMAKYSTALTSRLVNIFTKREKGLTNFSFVDLVSPLCGDNPELDIVNLIISIDESFKVNGMAFDVSLDTNKFDYLEQIIDALLKFTDKETKLFKRATLAKDEESSQGDFDGDILRGLTIELRNPVAPQNPDVKFVLFRKPLDELNATKITDEEKAKKNNLNFRLALFDSIFKDAMSLMINKGISFINVVDYQESFLNESRNENNSDVLKLMDEMRKRLYGYRQENSFYSHFPKNELTLFKDGDSETYFVVATEDKENRPEVIKCILKIDKQENFYLNAKLSLGKHIFQSFMFQLCEDNKEEKMLPFIIRDGDIQLSAHKNIYEPIFNRHTLRAAEIIMQIEKIVMEEADSIVQKMGAIIKRSDVSREYKILINLLEQYDCSKNNVFSYAFLSVLQNRMSIEKSTKLSELIKSHRDILQQLDSEYGSNAYRYSSVSDVAVKAAELIHGAYKIFMSRITDSEISAGMKEIVDLINGKK